MTLGALLLWTLLAASVPLTGPIDCGQAAEAQRVLHQEEIALIQVEIAGGGLSRAERARLAAVRKRRREYLACPPTGQTTIPLRPFGPGA